ncbi:hypothetical protein [Brevibacillus borstelensis]|nr:hypothetical protein [Brevibacillus borstelensis]WNF07218.1 hypothetical protein RFB14_07265 [Brevibacillus borstelensis]
MSINPRYVNASDELKGALVTYVHEVKSTRIGTTGRETYANCA